MKLFGLAAPLLALLVPLPLALAAENEYALQPLAYQNPGLEVDLGVGLWAYPMPMDYDGDGDLDLLVGCPDKPSQGTYYFENPSQDPDQKMPVFKAGVRIGNGFHYMTPSVINDEPVVMTPAKVFRRDAESGKFDFSKPSSIDAPSNPHTSKSNPFGRPGARTRANMWRYADYDGDGDHDILVGIGDWTDLAWDHAYDNHGQWRNGPLHGYVYLIVNEGDDDSPKYTTDAKRLQAGGGDLDVYGWPSPNMIDFDGDGDLDLLCGEFLDGFTYFQNVGTRTEPDYAAGEKLVAADGKPLVMDLQMITPTACDWDGDGDFDLIVGDEDGRVALVENTGGLRDSAPVFKSPVYFRQEADTLKFGALATPFSVDWDDDGDEDILCGNTAGNIAFFENLGAAENGLPRWAEPQLIEVQQANQPSEPFRVLAGPNGSIQGPCEAKWGYTTLSVADVDSDGDLDIVYNSILSRLGVLTNNDGVFTDTPFDSGLAEAPPAWYWWQTQSSASITQWRTTPMMIDFDGDDSLDFVMLDQEGYLTLRRSFGKAERIFVDEQGEPLRLNAGSCGRSGRIKLAVVDWDGDSRLDVLVNSENATWYRNCEDRDGQIVLKKVGNLARRNVAGHTSSPTVCDFNRDGKPDLLVGSENGRIYHIAHDDCISYDEAQTSAKPAGKTAAKKFPGWVAEEFINSKAPYPESHASTICETTRGLVAAWFGGTKERNKDVGIWTSYHDGLGWSKPTEVANGIQHSGLRYPCWNPVLYQPPGDAPTLLFFKVGPTPSQWWGEMMVSYDRGRTFVERRRLPEGIDGPVRCKPMLLDDQQTLLSGSSTEHDGWKVHFESVRLVDGQPEGTWDRIGPINDATKFNAIQPTILTHPDGRIQALCRTKESVIASTFSSDQGKTWTPLEAIDLPNPNSGIEAVTLDDGRHLLVYNHLDSGDNGWGSRGLLNLAISDDGLNWRQVGELDKAEKSEFSYPAIIQTGDGKVHITYTFNRKKIKHVTIEPKELK
ncbi:FG-GAP repeat protein [Rubripirellula lacrimiformis]|uniref:FG-GAP repeat protein n=1 Tax=Rubripirellula lacrimiformis TaxID=1930273 RepID=A0A517NBT7_9BACT|nr:exo-alpha-sialidase [Rubripirellula lacrimiformis]QDT04590.1 FG-GAP repeat protein [Rubripirellula lacrimiformis]